MRSSFRPPSPSSAVLILITAALLLPAVSARSAFSDPGAIAVVASQDVPLDNVTMAELRRLFTLERRFWKPGRPSTVLYPPPGSPARTTLLRDLCKADEQGLRRMMLEKMYRGEIDLAPKVVKSDEEAIAFVASGRGLLALVPARLADHPSVKILTVDGRRPGGPGYALTD